MVFVNNQANAAKEPYRLLWEAVCSGTADDIIRQANGLFGLPVVYVDEYFHMISMHPASSFGSAQWDEILKTKAMDREAVWKLLDENLSGKDRLYKPFFAYTGLCEKQPMLFGELASDGEVCGHVVVFWYGEPPTDGDFQLMDMVLSSLRVKLDGRGRGQSRWNMTLGAKLQDMLDPATPQRVKRVAVEGIEASISPEYVILVAPVGTLASHRAFGEYAVYQLRRSYSSVVAIVFDDSIVALLGEAKRPSGTANMRPSTDGLMGEILEFFESHNMICGLSNCFTDPAKVYVHYRQALLSARMAVADGADKSAVFMDLMPLPIFHSLKELDDPETFVHPAIYRMREYDRQNGTEYYETMREFSLSMHNRDKTAAKLSIHRNTLLYRLGRIGELFDLPYEDEEVALNLLCSFLLLL